MEEPKYPLDEGIYMLRRWCDLQERCVVEVRNKLYTWGYSASTIENWTAQLTEDGTLDEARFATAYASGKFRIKRWGKGKIAGELRMRGIASEYIQKALLEIDGSEYDQTLWHLASRKSAQNGPRNRKNDGATARFLIGKGYEPALVWKVLADLDGPPPAH